MTAPLTERGTFAVAGHEALVPGQYFDAKRVRTVYIGHTAMAGPPDPQSVSMTMPRNRSELDREIDIGFDVFERDLKAYAAIVDRKFGPLKPCERDGWTSWHFNTGGAYTSSAVAAWRAGNKAKAIQIMLSWNKITMPSGEKVVSGALSKRRKEEAAMIQKGKYPARDVAVWGTDGLGNVDWSRPLDLLDFEEVRRLAFDGPKDGFFDRLWRSIGLRRFFRLSA